jgi:sugar/nucleoside kinase (ribokinase family)
MSAASPARILCTGIPVLDQVFYLDRFPVPEEKTQARSFVTIAGGCATNAAIAAARLGANVRFAAPLGGPSGQDATGDRILADLLREGIDCSGVVRIDGAVSPLSAIFVDSAGERIIVNYRGDGLIAGRPADPPALLHDIDVVLADNRFPEFVLPICATARGLGLPVILDADKPTRATDALLESATHIIFSAEGLRATAGGAGAADLAPALLWMQKNSRAFLAVTDGANDILWIEERALRRRAVFSVKAIDTLAAGDVFHGAFAVALAEGRSESEALSFAAAAAALKCTRPGGGSGAPRRAEVEAFLAQRS